MTETGEVFIGSHGRENVVPRYVQLAPFISIASESVSRFPLYTPS